MRAHDLASSAVLLTLALAAGCNGGGPQGTTEDAGSTGDGETTFQTGGGGDAGGPDGHGTGGQGGHATGGQGGDDTGGAGSGNTTSTGVSDDGTSPCNTVWTRTFSGEIAQPFITNIAPDEKGDILVCGYFQGTMDAGGGPLATEGTDIFVAKLDSAGNHVWSKRFGGPMTQIGLMVPDGQGGFILTGQMEGSMDLGAGPLTAAAADAFVARFDSSGKLLWNKLFGGPKRQGAGQARVDSAGNIIFSGLFQESIDLGGGPLASAGDYDIFVAKLDPQGNHLWSKAYGSPSQQLAASSVVDSDGNIIVSGLLTGEIDFGGGPLASAGGFDVYIAKLDPEGNHLWSHRFGNPMIQTVAGLAVGPSGNVFLTGTFQNVVDFGGGPLTPDPGLLGDIFVVELDAAGNHVWSRGIGGDAQRMPYSIALDTDGNPVVTGQFTGTLALDGVTLKTTSPSDYDAFVVKLGPSGKHVRSSRFGDAMTQMGTAVAVTPSGQLLLGGSFDGTIDFGAGPLENPPHMSPVDFDLFVTSFDCKPAR